MVKLAIVEDDQSYIESLKDYIDIYMKENGVSIDVKVFRDGNKIAFDYQVE